jgi:hypothetical protein
VNPKAVPGMKKNFINMLNNKRKISLPLYLELEEVELDGKIGGGRIMLNQLSQPANHKA